MILRTEIVTARSSREHWPPLIGLAITRPNSRAIVFPTCKGAS